MSVGVSLKSDLCTNDGTIRDAIWRRYIGDDWAAFDQLPAAIRRRLGVHAYDTWSVNALILWRHYRGLHPTTEKAQRALLRYLDFCERLERRAFADCYAQQHGDVLPHLAAGVTVLRYEVATSRRCAA
ncbi:MAG: hypothetical protein JSR21_07705 [Proteobacteria bacterium]|nr:hypothetical protein [Pseudomonadota bacterium]